jgi:hypothetical protein
MQRGTGRESVSGPGSFLSATTEVREWLPAVIRKYRIGLLADIPCGDAHWIDIPKLQCVYVGFDVLPELIEANREGKPWYVWQVLDAVNEVPPPFDAILCRDLLVHLSLHDAQHVLANFRESGATWLIANTFPGEPNLELSESHPGWGWRPLDLQAPPFSLGEPVESVQEVVAGERWDRRMMLWRIDA